MSSFKIPAPSPHLGRNGFDLSSRRIFSASAGQLLPVGAWEVNPGEHFRFGVQDLVRTQPLNTAAFARCKEYYHFFFVPYRALWRWSDDFFTGVTAGHSSLSRYEAGRAGRDPKIYQKIPKSVPFFDLNGVIRKLYLKREKSLGTENVPAVDALGFRYEYGAYRLLHMLGYGISADGQLLQQNSVNTASDFRYDQVADGDWNLACNPFRLLAYQRIYNDFYRNQQWEMSNPLSFNIDYKTPIMTPRLDDVDAMYFCQMRYRQWNKDWLTSAIPTPNYDKGIFNLPGYVGSASTSGDDGVVYRDKDAMSVNLTTHNGGQSISVQDIRAAFALDKMLEATRRANGLDYSSQIAAHYGFKVPESRTDMAHFIGGFDNTISIGEVMATSAGSTGSGKDDAKSVPGQIYGKGIGSMNSHGIEFDSKEHGVIMCIYSVVPQPDYNAVFFDQFNRKFTREDYYQPEFQNLGYQPILGMDAALVNDDGSLTAINNDIIGYTPRYAEYKTARDVVYCDFMSGRSLEYWATPRFDFLTVKNVEVVKGKSTRPSFALSASNFMVHPSVLDPIFSVSFDGRCYTDQFLINSYFDVKAVRPMSVLGLSNI